MCFNKKLNNEKFQRIKDFTIIFLKISFLVTIFIIVPIILQVNNIYIEKESAETIFQVLATIIALSVSIFSIITTIFRDRIFGVYVSKYHLLYNSKYKYFSNFYLMFYMLCFIFLGLVFFLLKWNILLTTILVISILFIIKVFYSMFSLYIYTDKLQNDIKNYFLREIQNCSIELNNYKYDGDITGKECYLDKNPKCKELYNKLNMYLNDWCDDTIKKINENKYNEYSENINLIYNIYNELDFKNNNCFFCSCINIFSSNLHDIVELLIKAEQYELANKIISISSDYLYNLDVDEKNKDLDFKGFLIYFNYLYLIKILIVKIKTFVVYDQKYMYDLSYSIKTFSRYMIVFIRTYDIILKDELDWLPDLLELLYTSVRDNDVLIESDKNKYYYILDDIKMHFYKDDSEIINDKFFDFFNYDRYIHTLGKYPNRKVNEKDNEGIKEIIKDIEQRIFNVCESCTKERDNKN